MFSSSKNESKGIEDINRHRLNHKPCRLDIFKSTFGCHFVCRLVHTFQQWRKRSFQQSSLTTATAHATLNLLAEEEGERARERVCQASPHTTHTHHHNKTTHTPHTPHAHTQNTTHHTHHTTYQATDRDLESVFVKRKVNARICAPQATDRDLESVFNVNARICAHQSTDRDLETKK